MGKKTSRERCLICLTWHEPGKHLPKPADPPEIVTGQVPVADTVSGNPVPAEGGERYDYP